MPPPGSFLGSEPVLDADCTPVGGIAGAERSPDTRDTMSLLVRLDPIQPADDVDDATFCWLPADRVLEIRRDGVQINERLFALLPREDGRRGAHHSARR